MRLVPPVLELIRCYLTASLLFSRREFLCLSCPVCAELLTTMLHLMRGVILPSISLQLYVVVVLCPLFLLMDGRSSSLAYSSNRAVASDVKIPGN